MPGQASGAVLALNVGSSSVKFALFDVGPALACLCRGEVDTSGAEQARFVAHDPDGRTLADETWAEAAHASAPLFARLLAWIEAQLGGRALLAVGHRIVHGAGFSGPVRIDAEVLSALDRLCPLAPLHQPQGLAGVRALSAIHPDLPQTASFDTAFHAGHAKVVTRFGLPRRFEDAGVRRYGFHGLSYAYVAGRLRGLDPTLARGRVIVAHLGNGASLCALRDGRSVDTTMGFSALDGLVMGTRCGALDPGVVLYLQDQFGLNTQAMTDLLYRRSGLLGVSEISGDMRTLLASAEPAADEAVELFVFRAAREIGALVMSLGGLDGLVFTAGVGEHAPAIRALICDKLAWLGLRLDAAANLAGGERSIAAPESALGVWIVPTDEERMVASDAVGLVSLA
jgi:acetate kinase